MGILSSLREKVAVSITGIGLSAILASCAEQNPCQYDNDCSAGVCNDDECVSEGGECIFDNDCGDDLEEICVNNRCVRETPILSEPLAQITSDGVSITQFRPNSEGIVSFMENGELVRYILTDSDRQPITNAEDALLTYFDGNSFDYKCIIVTHPLYLPRLECAEHHSDHPIIDFVFRSLARIQEIVHVHYGNDRSADALERYSNWGSFENIGCWENEDIRDGLYAGTQIVKLGSNVLGVSNDGVDDLSEYLSDQLTEDTVADVRVWHGDRAGLLPITASVSVLDFYESSNGCTEGVPECTDMCERGDRYCDGNSQIICGNTDNDTCTEWEPGISCGDDVCDDGYCRDETTGCTDTCSTPGERICVGDVVESCRDYDADGCREWGVEERCNRGEYCEPSSAQCRTEPVSCTDECSIGEVRCRGLYVQSCEDGRGSDCNEWENDFLCDINQICYGGECVDDPDACSDLCDTETCMGNQVFSCVENITGCLSPRYSTTCSTGTHCEFGSCIPGAYCPDNECDPSTPSECLGDFALRLCTPIREEDCWAWSYTSCPRSDMTCISGRCLDEDEAVCFGTLPEGWITCACPETHGVLCHPREGYSCD